MIVENKAGTNFLNISIVSVKRLFLPKKVTVRILK
jgi:hypothetical protein